MDQTQIQEVIPAWVQGRQGGSDKSSYFLKRPFDVFAGIVGLLISAPLWAIFSAAIKLEDRGPIFFLQERWGKNKNRIMVYKFRTMILFLFLPHSVANMTKVWSELSFAPTVSRTILIGLLLEKRHRLGY